MKYKERPRCRTVIIQRRITSEMIDARPHGYSDGLRIQVKKMQQEGFDFSTFTDGHSRSTSLNLINGNELLNITDEELDSIEPIDADATHYKLTYYINLRSFHELVDYHGVTLDDLREKLTQVISRFVSQFPDGKPTAIPPHVRVDRSDGKKQQVSIYMDYS